MSVILIRWSQSKISKPASHPPIGTRPSPATMGSTALQITSIIYASRAVSVSSQSREVMGQPTPSSFSPGSPGPRQPETPDLTTNLLRTERPFSRVGLVGSISPPIFETQNL